MNKLKVSYFFKLLSLLCFLVSGLFSVSSAFALSQDSSAGLAEANLQNFDQTEDNATEKTPPKTTVDLNLYQVSTPVSSSSESERYEAFSKAFQKVLIKVSANPKVNDIPALKNTLKNAEDFIEQFSYIRTPSFQLNVHFNPDQINDLLKKAGQSVFNQQRPSIVVWIITKDAENNAHIAGSLSEDTISQDWEKTLRESANTIGLPIVFPFGDIDDLSTISSKNLWKITPKKLIEASERYGTQNILVIKINANETSPYITEWFLRPEDKHTIHWIQKGTTYQSGLEEGMTKTLQTFFLPKEKKKFKTKQNVSSSESVQIIHLSIFHIQSAEDYQLILNDLENQPTIAEVDIEKVTPAQVSYILHVKGNLTTLINTLSTHSELQFVQKNDLSKTLEYEFIGQPSANVWEEGQ